MKWTAIVVNSEGKFDHSFSFVSSHAKSDAFEDAQGLTPLLAMQLLRRRRSQQADVRPTY